jgi:hypothetical protein
MPYVPVSDTVEVELFQRLHGQRVENTSYWRLVGGYGTSEATDLWNNLLVWWNVDLAPNLSTDLTLVGGKITDLSTSTGFAIDFTAPTPNPAGDLAFGALPGNVALCVSIRTAGRGRSSRGRNYVAGLAENNVVGNTVDTSVWQGIETAYQSMRGLPFADAWEQVVVSRVSGGVPRVAGVALQVTSCKVVDPYVDSMRRRLTGRGL